MKEKIIEKTIINYLLSKGAVVEGIQSGKIMIKKGAYNHRMTLQSAGCPDIICFYKEYFIGIEVKKNEKEVSKWKSIEDRMMGNGKTLDGLTSYDREKDQVNYKYKILENGGHYITTCDVNEVILFIEEIDNEISNINI